MHIKQAHFVPGLASFYFDDQASIKAGAQKDGFIYKGATTTNGFRSIRQAGESISVLLQLENGAVAVGDCVAVQYSGAGGRDPLFTSANFIPFLENKIRPLLLGLDVREFKANSEYFDTLEIDGKPLHTAIRYGLSQALLDATAAHHQCLKTEVLCREYQLPIVAQPIPIFGQTGDDRYIGVDKMILKEVDALPHALINNIEDKLGHRGEKLAGYLEWLVKRITTLRLDSSYNPDLHIDVYGTIGIIFEHDSLKVADYIARLQDLVAPFPLYIEGPIDEGNKPQQIESMIKIMAQLQQTGSQAKLVADEWCNTYQDIVDFTDTRSCHMVQIKTPDLGAIHNVVDATLYCQQNAMQAYQGGSCNETDVSAKTCVHLALAARPARMLAKPGMGFDEGFTIVNNEMQRSVKLMQAAF